VQEEQIRAPLDQHWAASDANDIETEHRIYLRRGTGASWKWPGRVMSRSVGRAEPLFVRAVWSPGAVVYEPEPLDKSADGNVLVCCSQPTSDVVIDL
jgi:hypothetical protein